MNKNPYRSIVTDTFRSMLAGLPEHIQKEARKGFEVWKQDPSAVGWKKLKAQDDIYSVEIGKRYRAVGVLSKEYSAVVWMFVGSHEDYNKYINVRHTRQLGANALHRLKQKQVAPSITEKSSPSKKLKYG